MLQTQTFKGGSDERRTEEERRDDVLKYMGIYVDFVYRSGELYANENMTGFIGLPDPAHKPVWPQIRMLFNMLFKLRLLFYNRGEYELRYWI